MNLQDQVIYRCIHAACARSLPRRVNFCPWCGTGQHDGVVNPAHVARPAQAEYLAEYRAAYQEDDYSAPHEPAPEAPAVPVAPVSEKPVPAAPQAAPPPARPRAIGAAAPPRREPVRLRWWLIALAALWLIWIYAKPSNRKIEGRIESAMSASADCRFNDAQSELIALRMTKATPEQLARLQAAINAAVPGCAKKKQREKAWGDTTIAVESALAAGDFAKAQARLAQFTRRWSEDEETGKLKSKISEQKAAAPPLAPLPEPEAEARVYQRGQPTAAQQAQSARNLIDEAERELRAGNYKAAADKLETCITMVDEGNRECAAFKVHADRMQGEKQRCIAAGRQWYEDRCS